MAKGAGCQLTRQCSKCGIERPLEQFPRRPDRPSGRGTACLPCRREYGRGHYRGKLSYYLAKAHRVRQAHKQKNYEQLIAYLRSHPCVDCGEPDIRVLQFDHLDPSTKVDNVAALVREVSWTRVLKEIGKCVVRCGNCHRRKTVRERETGGSAGDRLAEEIGIWSDGCLIIDDHGPLAQWTEQRISTPLVESSTLSRPAAGDVADRYLYQPDRNRRACSRWMNRGAYGR